MVCANILLTLAALATFAFVVWPNWGNETVTTWVVSIAAALTIIVAWTMVKCKCSKAAKPKAEAPAAEAPAEEPKEEPKEE